MGIPEITLFGTGLPLLLVLHPFLHRVNEKFQFDDTFVSKHVDNAFQALALDECRASFTPAVWAKKDNDHTNLNQAWFPGVHSSVGGGDPDSGLSDIALAWMVNQVTSHTGLQIDSNMLRPPTTEARQSQTSALWTHDYVPKWPTKPWGCTPWEESFTGLFLLGGWKTRTPGKYYHEGKKRVSGSWWKRRWESVKSDLWLVQWWRSHTPDPYETNETIHQSVKTRQHISGIPSGGYFKEYKPKALKLAAPKILQKDLPPLGELEGRWRWGDDYAVKHSAENGD